MHSGDGWRRDWTELTSDALNGVCVGLSLFVFFARYHEMNIKQSLRDNLSYKTLIEYPVLHVVLRDHWEDYPLREAGKRRSYHAINTD